MWLYQSYRDFILEATGTCAKDDCSSNKPTKSYAIPVEEVARLRPILDANKGPPVLVAKSSEINDLNPMLEGRRRQPLPRIPGKLRGRLLAGIELNEYHPDEPLAGWYLPYRMGEEYTINFSVKSGQNYSLDVTAWPTPNSDGQTKRIRTLRRAANFLQDTPMCFSTAPSISHAYSRLERLWDDTRLEDYDPQVNLLIKQANQLRAVLDDLCARPRAMLTTEHRMLKLQNVRRIDVKTLHWLSAKPGRNTAERAGSRQRIKASKRCETIATLENSVLRAFAALTFQETKRFLTDDRLSVLQKAPLEAHHFRARRIVVMLRDQNVPEAQLSVRPNFPLRFDSRYNKIWRAWLELRNGSDAFEREWMWQHRTFMEILGMRVAMKFHELMLNLPNDGLIAHSPVLKSVALQPQGHYLNHREEIGAKYQFTFQNWNRYRNQPYHFKIAHSDHQLPLGAIAAIRYGTLDATIWWNSPEVNNSEAIFVGVDEFPWQEGCSWDININKWIMSLMALE